MNSQFHRLLNNQFHLIRFRQSLKKIYFRRQFYAVLLNKTKCTDHFVLAILLYSASVFSAVYTIADCNLLTNLHAQYIPDMIDIPARYHDPLALYL